MIRSKWVIAALAMTTVAVSLSACSSSRSSADGASGSKGAIRIGVMADLASNSVVGIGGKYGVQTAVKQINQHGGINGRQVNLSVEDSAGTANGGVAAARRLIEVDHVSAVIASASSDATIPTMPILAAAKVPLIVSSGADPSFTQPLKQYVFSGSAVPTTELAPDYVKFLQNTLHAKNVAIVQADAASVNSIVGLVTQQLPAAGITVATVQKFQIGASDFTAQVARVMSSNADVLFVFGDVAGKVIKQARISGYKGTAVYDVSAADPNIIKAAQPYSDGIYTFRSKSTALLDATTGPVAQWKQEFSDLNASPPTGVPNQFTIDSYVDTFVLAEAIRRIKGDSTGTAVVTSLESLKAYTPGSTPEFSYVPQIGVPHTYSAADHVGNTTATAIVVKGDHFEDVS